MFSNAYLYIFVTTLIRIILKIIPFGKCNPHQILFTSYVGKQYSCNPKYISEYIQEHAPEYHIIWAFQNPEDYQYLSAKGIEIVRYNSLRFVKKCLTSRYVITNHCDMSHIPFHKHQTVINTWHGGGAYKRVGTSNASRIQIENFRHTTAKKSPRVYLSSSRIFTDLTIHQSFHHVGEIIESGMPRNDMLVNQNREEIKKKVYDYYQLPYDCKILIYAPTYRENEKAEDYAFDTAAVQQALTERFGGSWVILFRLHYYIAEQLAASNSSYINASGYPDMQELLYASEVLITDYSSSMWDFSLMYRPCFLYATDLSEYDLKRGFYTDIHTWPYPLSETGSELISSIQNFDEQSYHKAVERHLSDFGNYETGHAAKTVLDYIREHP